MRHGEYKTLKERLEKNTMPIPFSGCLIWTGSTHTNGYGAISFNGQQTSTHRAVWTEANGEIPEGMCVLHRCDTPPCVNIDHLFMGTMADNMDDKSKKGRVRNGNPVGEENAAAKLSAKSVLEIRALRGLMTQREISVKYNVGKSIVSAIMVRKVWKHI